MPLRSPFASIKEIQQATLTYSIAGTIPTIDAETGVEHLSTTTGTFTAYVKIISDNPNSANELATKLQAQKVKAYCVEPSILPANIGQGSVLGYEFSDTVRSRIIKGKLTITKYAPSPITVVTEVLGDVFEGYLLVEATE